MCVTVKGLSGSASCVLVNVCAIIQAICIYSLNIGCSVALLPVFLYAVLHAQRYTKQLLDVSEHILPFKARNLIVFCVYYIDRTVWCLCVDM